MVKAYPLHVGRRMLMGAANIDEKMTGYSLKSRQAVHHRIWCVGNHIVGRSEYANNLIGNSK